MINKFGLSVAFYLGTFEYIIKKSIGGIIL